MYKTEGSVGSNVVNAFKFTVEKYIGQEGKKKLKPSKLLEMFTTLSFWFEDLKISDIKKIQDDITINGEKLFTDIELNEGELKVIDNSLRRFDVEMCEFGDIIQRSRSLFTASHHRINFEVINVLLDDEDCGV